MRVKQSPYVEALVTLKHPPSTGHRKLAKGEYVIASHDPVSHCCLEPCIHFEKAREHEAIPVIIIESIHHALFNIDEDVDEAWERFHGHYWNARRLLRC